MICHHYSARRKRSLLPTATASTSSPPYTSIIDINSLLNPDSQEPVLPQTPQKPSTTRTARNDRIRIETALDFNVPYQEIRKTYSYTNCQIE